MFTDHFWSPPYKDLINSNISFLSFLSFYFLHYQAKKQPLSSYQQHQNIQRFFTFQYPDFSFSSHISSSSSLRILFTFLFNRFWFLLIRSSSFFFFYSHIIWLFFITITLWLSSFFFFSFFSFIDSSYSFISFFPWNKRSWSLFSSYSQCYESSLYFLFTRNHEWPVYFTNPLFTRIAELTEYIKEALNEKNIRNDFVRILYQPASSFSPFHILSLPAAQSLAILFNTFYTYCVTQRDYLNALRLHKITATFIIQEQDHQVPLYSYLYTHAIYTKIGFWKELLVDYCLASHDEESAYQMQYHCLLDSQFVKTKKTKLSQSKL